MKRMLLLLFLIGGSIIAMNQPQPARAEVNLPAVGYDQKMQNQFVDAVRKGDYAQVQRMLKFRPRVSVNGLNTENENPLGVAVKNHDYKIVKLLFDNGVDANAQETGGMVIGYGKPLIFSIVKKGDDIKMIELFLEHGAKLKHQYKSGGLIKTMNLIDEVRNDHPNAKQLRELLQGSKTKIL